jgi:hypothetical protein
MKLWYQGIYFHTESQNLQFRVFQLLKSLDPSKYETKRQVSGNKWVNAGTPQKEISSTS